MQFCTVFENACVFLFSVFFFVFLMQLFRPLLNISLEFSAEELETALLTPSDTLSDVHMPLLKVGAFWFFPSEFMAFHL